MSNQTIDGVPELLARLESLDVDGYQGWAFEAADKLRALLDAPSLAGQPQGEPVAWLYTRPEQPEGAQRVPDVLLRERANPADVGGWKEQALFAEQPAHCAHATRITVWQENGETRRFVECYKCLSCGHVHTPEEQS